MPQPIAEVDLLGLSTVGPLAATTHHGPGGVDVTGGRCDPVARRFCCVLPYVIARTTNPPTTVYIPPQLRGHRFEP